MSLFYRSNRLIVSPGVNGWRGRTSDTVSAILSLVTTTANLLRATLETVNLFSISDGLAFRSTCQLNPTQ